MDSFNGAECDYCEEEAQYKIGKIYYCLDCYERYCEHGE